MKRVLVPGLAAALIATASAQQMQITIQQGAATVGQSAPARDAATKTGTAVLRGRIFAADTGTPLRRAQVRATNPDNRETRGTSTDAQGRFEFKELPAGRWTIAASKGSYVPLSYGQTRPNEPGKPVELADNQTLERLDITLPRGAIVTGLVVDEFGEPVSDAMVLPQRFQYINGQRRLSPTGRSAQTNDIGEYRLFGLPPGQYYVSATLRTVGMPVEASDDRSGYAPTYFPGTANVAEAQRVSVQAGQQVANINMALAPIRTARVSGTAIAADGRPMSGAMILTMQTTGGMTMTSAGNQVRPDGTFRISGLAPGDYQLVAQAGGLVGGDPDFATADVSVAGADVDDVRLVASKPSRVSGQVVVEGNPPAFGPTAVSIVARPADPERMMLGIGRGKVADDWNFELSARPGRMLLRAIAPQGYAMKMVLLDGEDVTDRAVDIRSGQDLTGVQVVLSAQVTELNGQVIDDKSQPIRDYTVIAFADNREKWGYLTRYVDTGRPDQDGRYKVRGLPPGEYLVIAVDAVEQGEWSDPEYLERIRPKARRVLLGDGETKPLDLKVVPMS